MLPLHEFSFIKATAPLFLCLQAHQLVTRLYLTGCYCFNRGQIIRIGNVISFRIPAAAFRHGEFPYIPQCHGSE